MKEEGFEVGVVYRGSDSRLWLAVAPGALVRFEQGKVHDRHPHKGNFSCYTVMRAVSVARLCAHWGIGEPELEELTRVYFSTSPTALRLRPRGPRHNAQDLEDVRVARTHRLASPRRAKGL